MNKRGILIFGLVTAIIHLYLNVLLGKFSPLFTLNGIGFLVLTWAVYSPPAFLKDYLRLVYWVYIIYTAVTILAFFAIGGRGFAGKPFDLLGYITKVDEVLLLIALWKSKPKS